MKHRGKVIGALIVLSIFVYWWMVIGDIDTRHICFVLFFGAVGIAIGRRYDGAIFNANRDELTGTYNRKFIHALYPKLLAGADRNKSKLTVFLIDLDRLKYVNDTFGHRAGDEAISNTAAAIQRSIRNADIVARWGGDEFVVLAPDMDRDQAKIVKERIESSVEEAALDDGLRYGASVGYALYPEDARTLDGLIEAADERMYKGKAKSHEARPIYVGEPI